LRFRGKSAIINSARINSALINSLKVVFKFITNFALWEYDYKQIVLGNQFSENIIKQYLH